MFTDTNIESKMEFKCGIIITMLFIILILVLTNLWFYWMWTNCFNMSNKLDEYLQKIKIVTGKVNCIYLLK